MTSMIEILRARVKMSGSGLLWLSPHITDCCSITKYEEKLFKITNLCGHSGSQGNVLGLALLSRFISMT